MLDFDQIARQLMLASNRSLVDRLALLKRLCPRIVQQIEQDRGCSGPLIFWGRCRNVDEFAGTVIVQSPILELIFHVAQQPFFPRHPHASLQHTYGYLFSIIDTPFGKKRDRWVHTSLEKSLGLPTDLIGPSPSCGTLLANVTWLAGSIAFRGHARRQWLQRCLSKRVAPTVRDLQLDQLPRLRVTETVALQQVHGRRARVSLIVDLVQLPASNYEMDPWLLVYSIADDRNRHPEIITLFTVSDRFVDSIRARASDPKASDIRLRYNAWVYGFPTEPQAGTVRQTSSHCQN